MRTALAQVLVLALMVRDAGGRKTSLTVEDDPRPGFLVEPFCFAGGGTLNFDVSAFRLTAGGIFAGKFNIAHLRLGVLDRVHRHLQDLVR